MLLTLLRRKRWYACGMPLVAIGGCVTDAQFTDFLRTQLVQLVSNAVGQIVLLVGSGLNPF